MMPSSNPTNTNLKIVIDTNLFLSVFAFRGQMVNLLIDLVINRKLEMYYSPALKEDLKKKFEFFKVSKTVIDDVMEFINTKGILLEPNITIEKSRDKKDNFLLELAETANADYLVTRDEDLLVFKKWKNTKIIKPEDFLPLLRDLKLIT